MAGGRHFERVDWRPNPTRPPDLSAWPFTIPCVAQIIAAGGFDLPAGVTFLLRPGARAVGADFTPHGYAYKVAQAWRARPTFRIFPDIAGVLGRCTIPRGGGGTVAGLCEAKLYRSRQVAFLEHWPLSKPPGGRHTAGWIVTLDRSARAVTVHVTGSTPPKYQR